jgi:hypothetical protein
MLSRAFGRKRQNRKSANSMLVEALEGYDHANNDEAYSRYLLISSAWAWVICMGHISKSSKWEKNQLTEFSVQEFQISLFSAPKNVNGCRAIIPYENSPGKIDLEPYANRCLNGIAIGGVSSNTEWCVEMSHFMDGIVTCSSIRWPQWLPRRTRQANRSADCSQANRHASSSFLKLNSKRGCDRHSEVCGVSREIMRGQTSHFTVDVLTKTPHIGCEA